MANECAEGYYWNPATETCELLSTYDCELDPPAAPSTPVLTPNYLTPSVSIASGAFPTDTDAIKLERSENGGAWEQIHIYTVAGSWVDTDVVSPGSYQYRTRACNASGCSAYTATATANLTSAIVPVWTSPADESDVVDTQRLVASAGALNLLYATDPVTMKLWGGNLTVNYNTSTNQWYTDLDTTMEYQGEIEVVLQARDLAGRYSNPVTLTLNVNNSIERNTRWSEKTLPAERIAELEDDEEQITTIGYFAKLVQRDPESAKRWFRWYVISPAPTAATTLQLADNAVMSARVSTWQPIAPDETVRLNTPASSARLAMQSMPAEVLVLYDLESEAVLKMRQFQEDKVEILTQDGYFEWSDEGLTNLAAFEDYETVDIPLVGVVVDGAKVGTKIYLTTSDEPGRVAVLDLTAGKISTVMNPLGDTRNVRAIEKWKDAPLIIYGDNTTATGYLIQSSTDDIFTLTEAVKYAWVREGRLFLATGGTLTTCLRLKEVVMPAGTASVSLLVEHTANITAVQVFETEAETVVEFGDTNDSAYRIEDDEAVQIASSLGGDVSDLGRFQGSAAALRGVLSLSGGANVARLFINESGAYTPQWELEDIEENLATKIVAMARVVKTLRAASGNPLMGGDAGLFSESLVVAFHTTEGAFLARLQEASIDTSLSVKATAVSNQNFKVIRTRPVPEETP